MKVAIIGAGPAGLSAAYELSINDIELSVFEKDPTFVGGISRTVEYHGYRFDIGGHRFFSKSQEVENFWSLVLGDEMLIRGRLSRIYYDDKLYDYPLKPGNAFRNMGVVNTALCIFDYLKTKVFPRKDAITFEDWVINNFGKRLYRMFFKAYTEKVWGISCTDISADWAAQRIKGLSLASAIRNAFTSQNNIKSDVIKTLIEEFRYPKFGPGMFWEAVASRITCNGGNVQMGQEVFQIHHDEGRVLTVQARDQQNRQIPMSADCFISSMPLRSLVRALNPSPSKLAIDAAESLSYRDFLTVALIIDTPDLFPDNWIYIHDPNVKVGRIQNFKNWSPFMVPNDQTTCLGLEYFCFEADDLWSASDEELIKLAVRELKQIRILKSEHQIIDGKVVRVPKAYPVYDDNYKQNVAIIVEELKHIASNLQLIGRNGMHRYNNQDHAMMTGFLAARNILGGNYDLWAVNSDAEYLEEGNRRDLV